MTDRDQTQGREDNGAVPTSKPGTPDAKVKQTGRQERTTAGPDGPDASEVGDTFKNAGTKTGG